MDKKEVIKAAIVAAIAISAPIVVLDILSFQTARAQSSSESSRYDYGVGIGISVGYNNGYSSSPYFAVDPNGYCSGDADCITGFWSSYGTAYNVGQQAAISSILGAGIPTTGPNYYPGFSTPCAMDIHACP